MIFQLALAFTISDGSHDLLSEPIYDGQKIQICVKYQF